MKFFIQGLLMIAVLVSGFVAGVRYQAQLDTPEMARSLVRVQKTKISSLREESLRLRTVLRLREFLDEVRIRLPRATVDGMADSIYDASERYDVPPEMVLAVIRIESAFDINAESNKGAVGLMQILPTTAREIASELRIDWPGEEILRDPSANIEMGTYYLTKLLGQFNDLSVALTAYNHGPGKVARLTAANADLPLGYSEKVLRHYSP